jgi:hypothetical protein
MFAASWHLPAIEHNPFSKTNHTSLLYILASILHVFRLMLMGSLSLNSFLYCEGTDL